MWTGDTSKGSRSIPACAGEPPVPVMKAFSCGVYPRVCGGTNHAASALGRRIGLSPRVRGNPGDAPQPGAEGRSIPACAGEPAVVDGDVVGLEVYPRVCGGTRSRG